MQEVETFVALAEATGQGRLSAAEFKVLCRPLFRFAAGRFMSREGLLAARDLFFVAEDYWDGEDTPPPEALTAAEVQAQAAEIAVRLRAAIEVVPDGS
jgi:hypothetical protein